MILVSGQWKFVQEGAPRRVKAKAGAPIRRYLPFDAPHRGTLVELVLHTDRPIDIARVVGEGRTLMSVAEETRLVGNEVIFDVAAEAADLGTRDAGRGLRNRVLNLTRSDPTERFVLDFARVDMLSSSFADEFVAKLAASLGRDLWNRQFELRNLKAAANTVIQIALWHRLG